jgi:hypothetical protein
MFDGGVAADGRGGWTEAPARTGAPALTRSGGVVDRSRDQLAATPIFAEMLDAWDGPCAEFLARV